MRFGNTLNQIEATIPDRILEILSAHHTPRSPMPAEERSIANGIRSVLKVILIIAGGIVLPVP